MTTTTAIIRHIQTGDCYLAALDESGRVTGLSAPWYLPDSDHSDQYRTTGKLTDEQWCQELGYADVEPVEDGWRAGQIEILCEVSAGRR